MNILFDKVKQEALNTLRQDAGPKKGFGVCGWSLPQITNRLADILGDMEIVITFPYANFECRGKANDVNSDVMGVMPFSKSPKELNWCTTLFYGPDPVHNGNFIPFQSQYSCYFISDTIITEKKVTIILTDGPNINMYM